MGESTEPKTAGLGHLCIRFTGFSQSDETGSTEGAGAHTTWRHGIRYKTNVMNMYQRYHFSVVKMWLKGRRVKNTWRTSKSECSHLLLCNLQGNTLKLRKVTKRDEKKSLQNRRLSSFFCTEDTNSDTDGGTLE
jgi:hypothetical protein